MSGNADVRVEIAGPVATLRLNRAEAANSFRTATARAIEDAVEKLNGDDQVCVVLVRGSSRVFSAGLDLSMLDEMSVAPPDEVALERDDFYTAIGSVARIRVPTVAVLEGPAVTGGVGLAALCDLRIATPRAWMQLTFSKLAFSPGLAVPQMVAARGSVGLVTRALFTAERIGAEELHRHGFYEWLVEEDQLERTVADVAAGIAACDRPTLMQIKRWLEHEVIGVNLRRTFWLEGALEGVSTSSPGFETAIARVPNRGQRP